MIYNSDKPIEKEEQDILGRLPFSNKLGNAIYNCEDSLVIGLFGKWGYGKTSIIRLVENKINILAKDDKNKPLIIRFSPWNYNNKNDLIELFFNSLIYNIKKNNDSIFKNKVLKLLIEYSEEATCLLGFIPIIGNIGAKIINKLIKRKKSTNLETSKQNLEDALIEAKKKLLL